MILFWLDDSGSLPQILNNMLAVILLFYRNFRVFTHAVAWGGWLVAGAPSGEKLWSFLALLFWLKLASYGVIWVLMQTFSRQIYLFYQNLGYSITALFAGAFGLDLLLFFGLLMFVSWSILLF
jgi:hypothetical protein